MDHKTVDQGSRIAFKILRLGHEDPSEEQDLLAVEGPLEIQLVFGPRQSRQKQQLAVTLRSPGADVDLALGFLFSEGIIGRRPDVKHWEMTRRLGHSVLRVSLAENVQVDSSRFDRKFGATVSCGLCGKGSLESIFSNPLYPLPPPRPVLKPEALYDMAKTLRAAQHAFEETGGMHAAGLFHMDGRLRLLREDIGRHNALDKLIGAAWQDDAIPLYESLILVSGRVGFELVQKAAMAGLPMLAAVGAASSMAVELAVEQGMTLLGFLRSDRVNCYSGPGRLIL